MLSQRPREHLPDFLRTYPPALDQADHPAEITHDGDLEIHTLLLPHLRVRAALTSGRRSGYSSASPLIVVQLLFRFPLWARVVGRAAPSGRLSAMGLPAAKRTTEILAPSISRIRKKVDPTMPAAGPIEPQMGFLPEQRAQDDVVLPDQSPNIFVATVPLRAELEVFLDFNYQKPRVWLMIETLHCTPLSYPLDTSVTRGRTRDSVYSRDAFSPRVPAIFQIGCQWEGFCGVYCR